MKHVYNIDVELQTNEAGDEVRVILRSDNGARLTTQDIVDAVADAVFYELGANYVGPEKLDS